jgi:hypothetical protein
MTAANREQISSANASPRPEWRDEFLHNLAALEKYADELRRWQPTSPDPLDRVECCVWQQITGAILNVTFEVVAFSR